MLFWPLWNFLIYSSPDRHPRISQREKEYIAAATGIKTSISQVTVNTLEQHEVDTRVSLCAL